MITELLFFVLFGLADLLLGLFPALELSINTSAWSGVGDFLAMIAYLLPMGHVKAIISVIIALALFRIGIAVLKTIKSFIPGLG